MHTCVAVQPESAHVPQNMLVKSLNISKNTSHRSTDNNQPVIPRVQNCPSFVTEGSLTIIQQAGLTQIFILKSLTMSYFIETCAFSLHMCV